MTSIRIATLAALLLVIGTMARRLDEFNDLQELRKGYTPTYYKPATRYVYTKTYTYNNGGYHSGYHNYNNYGYNSGYNSYSYSSYGNGGGAVYGGGGFGCICCIIICILCCRGSQNQGDGYQENGGQVTETVVVETYNVAPNQGYGGQPNQYPPNQGYGGQP